MSYLTRVANSPYLHLLSGLVLVATALAEFFDAVEDPSIGVHHGVLVMGLVQVLQALPHLVHGLHDLEEAKEGLAGDPSSSEAPASPRGEG